MDATSDYLQRAHHYIKEQILNLEYRPGAPLRAQVIADAIKVSRTPVREALSKLELEGLVVRGEGWGYVVKPISVKEALDLYRVREVLDVEAVREVVPLVSVDFLKELKSYLRAAEDLMRKHRLDAFRHESRAFYQAIARQTGNVCLQAMLNMLNDQIRLLGAMIAERSMDRPKESLAENRELLRALEVRDSRAAELAVRKHVSQAKETFLSFVTARAAEVPL
jgi:DNA-binding GntR family transcriptional regulator